MLRRPALTFDASTKRRIYLRRWEVIGFVFHSASAILEIDGSDVSDGEIEILPPPSSRSLSGIYTGGIVETLPSRSIEINETKIRKRKTHARTRSKVEGKISLRPITRVNFGRYYLR